ATFGMLAGEYTPMQVKLHVTGYGKAEKPEVQWAVAKLLGLPEIVKPDDASDALAIALTHARLTCHLSPRLERV
ncbi:MAG: crossover junction endodeoxyribonuclease RuvC, partial [Cyanobacteria bacterium PR.023]|nr:crossover junction endodeoxyribonuclease RuvC [Cyanobacteria bacterium PR.023]